MAAPAMPGGCGPIGGGSTAVCGNGVVEGIEQCDGNDSITRTCAEFSTFPGEFVGGTLTCTLGCMYNFVQCRRPVCGDDVIEGHETCEGDKFLEGADLSCANYSDEYRAGTLRCADWCLLDDSGCVTKNCGNGKLDTDEFCDGNEFLAGSDRCEVLSDEYEGGTVLCKADCTVDTAACRRTCGNGNIDVAAGEQCDGANLGNATCVSIDAGYLRGALSCDANCHYDVSSCVGPVCGDGVIEGNEVCDGPNLGSLAGRDCSEFIYGTSIFGVPTPFLPGPLKCPYYCGGPDPSECRPQPGCYISYPGGIPTTPTIPRIYCIP